MKSVLFSCVIVLFLSISATAEPTGKILILDNESLVEGDIRREGDRYIIQRGRGQTIIPAQRVIDLVADRHAAFQLMRERCNRHDYDDRLRLVRWCIDNGMRGEALAEAEGLLQFRPDDALIQRMVQGLRTLKMNAPEATKLPAPVKLSERILEVEPLDYNRDSFAMFVSKVQPILMNVCASCHASGQGGNYPLSHIPSGGDRKATLFNLASTLKQLKRTDLGASPLLEKAVAAHGKSSTPPFRPLPACPAGEGGQQLTRTIVNSSTPAGLPGR